MTPLLLLALQGASAAPAPPPPLDVRTIDFDLARYRPGPACDGAAPGGILVCARRPAAGAYPLEAMAKLFEQGPIRAETRLFGTARGGVRVEQVGFPNGQQSKRLMVGIKLPF